MDQIWPASPPLQDINQLPIGPDDAVLGVGMAGRSHWSASYSLEQRPAARCCIKADLACLVKMDDSDRLENPIAPPVQLGSTYELGEGCQIRSVHQSKIEITTPTNQRVVLEAIEDEESATVLRVNHSTLSIAPGRISKSPVRATRWAFRVFVAD